MTQSLLINTIALSSTKAIGHLTLNNPKALNALNLPMAKAMLLQLLSWEKDANIAFVLISGSGGKAFCAGGDVVAMYHAINSEPASLSPAVTEYFCCEYTLDHLIHRYQKPIVVWGDGIVMGGGMGLLAGASHRIVTPSSRLAMPEISIGLFPDVGASYFLSRMPGASGLFLGLTGCQFNAVDAVHLGIADFLCDGNGLAAFIAQAILANWCGDAHSCAQQLTLICEGLQLPEHNWPQGKLTPWLDTINRDLATSMDVASAIEAINKLAVYHDEWLSAAITNLRTGSPVSQCILWEQLRRGRTLNLAECFAMELTLACRSSESGEFAEGVRALLIDKDRKPNWRYTQVNAVPESHLAWHFSAPWTQHPLAHLKA